MNSDAIKFALEQLHQSQSALLQAVEAEQARLKSARDDLEKEKADWEAMANKLDRTLLPNMIKLNVGGTVFATSKSTLLVHRGSFFEGMFGGRFDTKPEEDGCYFIDRNPCVFGQVLDYMRGRKLKVEKLSEDDLEALKEDAEFYQLQGLLELFETIEAAFDYKFLPGPNYSLSSNETQATIDQHYGAARKEKKRLMAGGPRPANVAIVKGKAIPSRGVTGWKITFLQSGSQILVGIAPSSIDQNVAVNPYTLGFFVNSSLQFFSGPPFNSCGQTFSHNEFYAGRRAHSEIGLIVDMDARTVEVYVNNQSCGIAYRNIPRDVSYCPCVILQAPYDSVSISAL